MDTQSLEVFLNAARIGSLSGAARRLKLTPMSATRRLASLEEELGVRLFHRTSRSLSLTPEGEAFLHYAEEVTDTLEAARETLLPSMGSASGLLRITAPITLGRKRIMPVVHELLNEHPDLRIELDLNDSMVDLVASGMDLGIRIAPMKDSSLIARKLADNPKHIYAAPSYLEAHGAPETIDDLANHQCLTFSNFTHWNFIVDGKEKSVRVSSRFSSSSVDGFQAACVCGLGLAQLSAWDIKDELENGSLVPVHIEGASPRNLAIWAVFPSRRQVLPKLKVFLDRFKSSLA